MDDVVHLPPVVEIVRIDVNAVDLVPDGEIFHDRRVLFVQDGIRIIWPCSFRGQDRCQEDSQRQEDSDELFQI